MIEKKAGKETKNGKSPASLVKIGTRGPRGGGGLVTGAVAVEPAGQDRDGEGGGSRPQAGHL